MPRRQRRIILRIKTKDQNNKEKERPKFGLPPDYDSPDFNFKRECERLPFPLNIGEVPIDLDQQKRFIELIYDNKKSSLYMMGI